jgi:hypothetical protein
MGFWEKSDVNQIASHEDGWGEGGGGGVGEEENFSLKFEPPKS